jgi:PiT family inorganic phosphate transporter
MAISVALFIILAPLANKIRSFITFALVMKLGVIVVGCYGAYTLGANNVANVTGAFVGAGLLGPSGGAIIGGAFIALGALTYSKGVMMSVGKKIFPLGSFSAFIAVLASALTLHFFTQLRVPVSNSQAIVGSIAGIGFLRGTKAIDKRMLFRIFTGWVATPLLAAGLSFTLLAL